MKQRQLLLTSGFDKQNSGVGKLYSDKEVFRSSQYPRVAMLWISDVEDAESIDDLIISASISGRQTNSGLRES